jgi:hypothetical protein
MRIAQPAKNYLREAQSNLATQPFLPVSCSFSRMVTYVAQ